MPFADGELSRERKTLGITAGPDWALWLAEVGGHHVASAPGAFLQTRGVTGDEVYGSGSKLCTALEKREQGYVRVVRSNQYACQFGALNSTEANSSGCKIAVRT